MVDKQRTLPELLAPAGDLERLKMAVLYGADAVYLAGTDFGMRAFAGNFDPDELKAAAKRLENAGADILLMPCNTAHYFYPAIQASTKCPILHMLRLTAEEIKSRGHIKVALLATDGTVKTGIYAKLFEEYGIDYMLPEPEEQRLVMSMIYDGIKADNEQYFDTEPIKAALRAMQQRGADAFVLGCTELPIAFDDFELDFPTVDPTRVLAKNAVLAAGYELKTK